MLVVVEKRSGLFLTRTNKAHPLAWSCWCLVNSPSVVTHIGPWIRFVLALCRFCAGKEIILFGIQCVATQVLKKPLLALKKFSTVCALNLFSDFQLMHNLLVSFQRSNCHVLLQTSHRLICIILIGAVVWSMLYEKLIKYFITSLIFLGERLWIY